MVWEKRDFLEVSIANSWKIEATGMVHELWNPGYPTGQALWKNSSSLRLGSSCTWGLQHWAQQSPGCPRPRKMLICIYLHNAPRSLWAQLSQAFIPQVGPAPPASHSCAATQYHPLSPAPPVGHRAWAARSPGVSDQQR